MIDDLEQDYKRRQGNLVINLCKFIKPEYYERDKKKKYKANDKRLKRRLTISRRKTNGMITAFIKSFGDESKWLEREYTNKLREAERAIEREKRRQSEDAKKEQEKESNRNEMEGNTDEGNGNFGKV